MDWIEATSSEIRHALAEKYGIGSGVTFCGKTLHGTTGGCIAALISCKSCRAGMRKAGWTV